MHRQVWVKSPEGHRNQELWFVGTRIDHDRSVADVGIRTCGSSASMYTFTFPRPIQMLVFKAATELTPDAPEASYVNIKFLGAQYHCVVYVGYLFIPCFTIQNRYNEL